MGNALSEISKRTQLILDKGNEVHGYSITGIMVYGSDEKYRIVLVLKGLIGKKPF